MYNTTTTTQQQNKQTKENTSLYLHDVNTYNYYFWDIPSPLEQIGGEAYTITGDSEPPSNGIIRA